MVAAAIIGGAVFAGGATIVAGSSAASATRDATNASIAQQNAALDQQKKLEQPYMDLGTSALDQYKNLLGLGTGGTGDIQKTLAATPGYQFAKEQGLTATTNAATATGMALSGNTLEALDKFSTGLADSTYQNAVGNSQAAVGLGQAAASGQAANVGNVANNNSNALLNQGNTIAGIDANTAAGLTKAIGNGVNQYVTNNTLQGLLGPGGTASPVMGGGGLTNYPLATPNPVTTNI